MDFDFRLPIRPDAGLPLLKKFDSLRIVDRRQDLDVVVIVSDVVSHGDGKMSVRFIPDPSDD